MAKESTTRDLVELMRRGFEAVNRRELDAMLGAFAQDAVWEAAPLGVSLKGVVAIRGFFEDWIGSYEEFEMEPEEIRDLGYGVVFSVVLQRGRPLGSTGVARVRSEFVMVVVGGMIAQVTAYVDIDEARAAAERLAKERE